MEDQGVLLRVQGKNSISYVPVIVFGHSFFLIAAKMIELVLFQGEKFLFTKSLCLMNQMRLLSVAFICCFYYFYTSLFRVSDVVKQNQDGGRNKKLEKMTNINHAKSVLWQKYWLLMTV